METEQAPTDFEYLTLQQNLALQTTMMSSVASIDSYDRDESVGVSTAFIEGASSCWFLSVACLDDVRPCTFSNPPDRSAFVPYQRPVEVVSLFDATLEEEEYDDDFRTNNEDESRKEERDDVDCESNDHDSIPPIERTFSFDDWDTDDEIAPVQCMKKEPKMFRFDAWDDPAFAHGEEADLQSIDIDYTLKTIDYVDELRLKRSHNCRPIHIISSMETSYSHSDSYMFQPIRDGSCQCETVDPSIAPATTSITAETLSISVHDHNYESPSCRGIPRVASADERDVNRPSIVPFNVEDSSVEEMDQERSTSPTATCNSPPIPQTILVPREIKGLRQPIQQSLRNVLTVRVSRTKSASTRNGKGRRRFFKNKRTMGEF